jgi:hypothetical protein
VMDIFDLADLQICPWALREGVILERLDHLSDRPTSDASREPAAEPAHVPAGEGDL